MNTFTFIFIFICLCANCSCITCPLICKCDLYQNMNRASCVYRKIVDIDVGVSKFVQIYNLSSNSISKLENKHFNHINYTHIELLDLSYNIISWIELHAFVGLTKLREINLAHNRIEHIDKDLFWYNKNLTVLNLSGNKFMKIQNEPFLRHLNLTHLDLSNCSISHLPENTFMEMANLQYIDLSGNYMTVIKIDVLNPLTKLSEIDIEKNNWTCNEKMKELKLWLSNKNVKHKSICMGKIEKKFEKIQVFQPVESSDEREKNLDELWNPIEEPNLSKTLDSTSSNENIEKQVNKSFFELYNDKMNSWVSLIIGFTMGILIGMYLTYFWVSGICQCKTIKVRNDNMMRSTSIIWEPHNLYYTRNYDIDYESDEAMIVDQSETPPPAYNDCMYRLRH